MASYNFGLGPAMIVLTIPTNVQPNRFFNEEDARFRLIATIGEAPKAVDKAIKEVVKPVAKDGAVEQADVEEAQSSEEG